MTLLIAVLLLIGAVFILVVFCAVSIWLDKKATARMEKAQKEGTGFDERQIIAQGKAYTTSSVTLAVYYGCLTLFLMECEDYPANIGVWVGAGLLVGSLVYSIYCLMTDAMLPLDKGMVIGGIGFFVGGVFLLMAVLVGNVGKDITMISDAHDWINLISGIWGTAMGVIYLIAYLRDKREEK